MPNICVICKNKEGQHKVTFHRFPKDENLTSESLPECSKNCSTSDISSSCSTPCSDSETQTGLVLSQNTLRKMKLKKRLQYTSMECLKNPGLCDEAIPVRVGGIDLYNDGSIILNDRTNISNNIGTSCGDGHDVLSSINSDHCYTTIQIQENKIAEVNHDSDVNTMNGLKRDAALFNVELTSSLSKRIKPSQTWW
ncbi:uncharacterized protein LOC111036775 isoform X2 [Myzus persicae]|uniref:uncharacterized protein LOC111036775 isoform X2 n=1 Tax=Myzus persicae TaxID=13164 RepID=UPI000B9377FB|nr:uncharacterized protein LOC111036775 isoform X2 [Myzus persicae]